MEEDKKEASTFLGRYDRQPITSPSSLVARRLRRPRPESGQYLLLLADICRILFGGHYLLFDEGLNEGSSFDHLDFAAKKRDNFLRFSVFPSSPTGLFARFPAVCSFHLFFCRFNGEKNGRISFLAQFSHSVLGRSFNKDGYLLSLFWSVWLSILLFQFIICFLERFLLF